MLKIKKNLCIVKLIIGVYNGRQVSVSFIMVYNCSILVVSGTEQCVPRSKRDILNADFAELFKIIFSQINFLVQVIYNLVGKIKSALIYF